MGIGFVVVGAALVLLSFTTFDWYTTLGGADSVGSARFADLHHLSATLGADALSKAYFTWASWVTLILLILVGSFASTPRRGTESVRVVGLIIGLIGAALTYYTLHKLNYPGHRSTGVWLAYLGFLLGGIGAAIGPWPFTPRAVPAATEPPTLVDTPAAVPRPRPRPRPGPTPEPDQPVAPEATDEV